MLRLSYEDKDNLESFQRFDVHDWNQLKDRITYKIVNKKYFHHAYDDENIIHEDCMDLSKIFMVSEVSHDREHVNCYLLTKQDLEKFDKNEEEIKECAKNNPYVRKQRRIVDLKRSTIIEEMYSPIMYFPEESLLKTSNNAFIKDSEDDHENILIVSNKYNTFGSCYMLDFNTLREVKDRLDSNFYIIPMSIHSFMCISKNYLMEMNKDIDEIEDDLLDMVYKINTDNKYDEDILSYRIYYYSTEDGESLLSIKQSL